MPQYHIDHYGILRVPHNASEDDIKKRVRKVLFLKFHPDKIKSKGRTVTQTDKDRWNDINNSSNVLLDSDLRGRYDRNHSTMPFSCIGSTCISRATPKGAQTSQLHGYKSEISKRYFCSGACANDWERGNKYTAETHGYSEGTGTGSSGHGHTPPTPPTTPPPGGARDLRKCPGCDKERRFISSCWFRYSSKDSKYSDKWCCTEYCLFEYLKKVGKMVAQCANCYKCQKEADRGGWFRGQKNRNDIFCCEEHRLEKEEGLGSGLGSSDPTGSNPPPTNIKDFRDSTINEINFKLNEEPKIKTSELSNPDWENKINHASEIDVIKQIRDEVLVDIDTKRKNKLVGEKFEELVKLAQEAANSENLTNLKQLLLEIKDYQNFDFYQSKKAIIDELEKKLAISDPFEYKESIINSLNSILKQDPIVEVSELNEANRNFVKEIRKASLEEVKKIEEAVQDDINYKRTEKKFNILLLEAQEVNKNDNKEVFRIRQEILRLMNSSNKYEKASWEKNKHKFEPFISQWVGKGKSSSPQPDQNSFFTKRLLIGLTMVALVGAIIAGLLIIRQKRRHYR